MEQRVTVHKTRTTLRGAKNPFLGIRRGPTEVEMTVDPNYPKTVASLPSEIRGLAVHSGGRNLLFLDGRVAFYRDRRPR